MRTLHLTSFCLIVLFQSAQNVETQKLPEKFHGIWRVISMVENGEKIPLAHNVVDGDGNGAVDLTEFIIQGDRTIWGESSGNGMICQTKITGAIRNAEGRSLLKIESQLMGWEGERDDPMHALLDVKDDQFTMTIFQPQTDVTQISDKEGDQQRVIKARLVDPNEMRRKEK